MSKILVEREDLDALEVLFERYRGHMSDLDERAMIYVFEKYNEQAYIEYKKLADKIKK